MRHGETLYLGRQSEDGSDLTPEGRRQIQAAAELFRAVPLDLVLSSPMRRAVGTATIVAASRDLRLVQLVSRSAADTLQAGLWEPSFERLRRVLEARGQALAGLRWQGVDRDPEV